MCQLHVRKMPPECTSTRDKTFGGSWELLELEPLVPPGRPVHPWLLWTHSECWRGGGELKSTGLWLAFAWEQVLGWCLPSPQIFISGTRGAGLGGEELELEKGFWRRQSGQQSPEGSGTPGRLWLCRLDEGPWASCRVPAVAPAFRAHSTVPWARFPASQLPWLHAPEGKRRTYYKSHRLKKMES